MTRLLTNLTFLAMALMLAGCASENAVSEAKSYGYTDSNRHVTFGTNIQGKRVNGYVDALIRYFEEWKGTPYRYGGTSKKGIDCSAFTQLAFRRVFSHPLPRTTRQQLTLGNKVSLKIADHGDLVFFKTGSQRYHVGIYLGEKEFMHASSSKGVIISRIDNPYWSARLLQVRRYPLD